MKTRRKKGKITVSIILIFCTILLLVAGWGKRCGFWVATGGGGIKYTRGAVTTTNGYTASTGDITATTGDIVASAGDVQSVLGDIVASSGNVVIPSGNVVAVDTIWALKTVTKTISVVVAVSADDFQFDDTQVNAAEQPIDLGSLVPAYAELVSAQIRCFEAVVGGTMSIDLGTSSGGAEILTAGPTDALNEINSSVAGDSPEIIATNVAKNVWINATPSANWDTLSAGRYSIMVTYIDYGAAHTWSIP